MFAECIHMKQNVHKYSKIIYLFVIAILKICIFQYILDHSVSKAMQHWNRILDVKR